MKVGLLERNLGLLFHSSFSIQESNLFAGIILDAYHNCSFWKLYMLNCYLK